MTIDVATLVFEFKSDSAGQAEKAMDRLIEKGDQLEATAKRVRLASDRVNEGHRGAAGAAERAAQEAASLANAQGAAERATRASLNRMGVSWREFVAERMGDYMRLEGGHGAAMKRIGAEWQAYKATATDAAQGAATAMTASQGAVEKATHSAARASSTLANQQERAARTAEVWRRRIENIEKAMDPASAVTVTLAQRTRDLDKALAVGGISAERHASMLARVSQAAAAGDEGMTRFSRGVAMGAASSKFMQRAGLDLSRQLADIGVTAASGMSPLTILIQQGPQIADVFAQGRVQGVGFTAMLRGVGAQAAGLVRVLAPVGLAIGALVGAFALFEREVDKSTKGTTTFGQTLQATMNVAGKAIMDSPIGDGIRWIGETFAMVMDAIVNGTMSWLDRMVGFWGAAYLAIVKNWRNLPQAIGAIMVGAVNNTIQTVEGMVNAAIKGINRLTSVVGWKAIAEVDLPRVKQASNEVAAQFVKDEARIAAAFRSGRQDVYRKIVAETERLAAAQKKGAKDAAGHASALKEVETAAEKARKEIDAYLASMNREIATAGMSPEQVKIMDAQAMAAKAIAIGYDDAAMAILRYADALILAEGKQKAWNPTIERTAAEIPKLANGIEDLRDHVRRLADAFDDVAYSFGGVIGAFKTGNFSRLIDDISTLGIGLQNLLKAGAGGIAQAGSAVALAIGGKGGRAIGGGLGLAGAGLTAGAFAGSAAGAGALATAGLGAGAISSIAALAGPIGIAAGALYAAAKLFNLGGKPTNAGAGYDLTTGAISGNKRTSETEQAAAAAGQAIQGIQDSLKAAGIGLTDSVRGLVIGTRDQTQIYLASGRELRSAVGDSGAAVDTAMRALLEGATYVSEAQKKLVDSALAAGKGFDAIAEILAQYEAAQKISGSLADEILRLTDPKAYDLQAVSREIEEARKSYQKLATDGYLTADQLATINAQLSTLEGLRLDEVMKRYAASVDAANDNLATLRGATESAEGMLRDAYDAYASAKQAEIAGLRQAAESLRAFRKELDFGAIAGRDPLSQYAATKREFDRLNALSASDPERLANLQSVSQAFLEASKIASPTELAFNRDLQAVRRATEASEMAATAQADFAQMQLDAQTAAVSQLIALNTTAISIEQAMFAVLAARANEVAGGGAANDNLDVGRYLALNPDLAANWNAGGSLRGAGMTLEDAARAHYATTGKWEVSQGLRTYATGGMHPGGLRLVGEEGPELEVTGPSRIYSARETAQMMGGDTGRLEALVESLTETVAAQAADIRALRNDNNRMLDQMKRWDGEGLPVRGEAPGEPVRTQAA